MFEDFNESSQKTVLEAYQKAAKEIGDVIINNGFNPEALAKAIPQVVEKLNKKFFFPLEQQLILEKSLGEILLRKNKGELTPDFKDIEAVENKYLDFFGEALVRECQNQPEDFYIFLGKRLQELKQQGIILDNKKIKEQINSWLAKIKESTSNIE